MFLFITSCSATGKLDHKIVDILESENDLIAKVQLERRLILEGNICKEFQSFSKGEAHLNAVFDVIKESHAKIINVLEKSNQREVSK